MTRLPRHALKIAAALQLFLGWSAHGQDASECRLILQEGLYRTTQLVKAGSFDQDLKTYLASDTFTQDFKAGKWGASIDVVVDAVPLGLNASSSETDTKTFQQRVRQSQHVTLSSRFYDYASVRIPDVDLARAFSECLNIVGRGSGLTINAAPREKEVTFVIQFQNQVTTDRAPRVTFFEVRGGERVSNAPALNSTLTVPKVVTVDRDPNKDLTLVIETDRGARSYTVPAEPTGFNAESPVGTLIASYLSWDEFQAITKNNLTNPGGNFWAAKYSRWSPADGRSVPNSAFQRATSALQVPDLRGRFLRALNSFDPTVPAIDASVGDPDGPRQRGSYQPDELKAHDHTWVDSRYHVNIGQGPYGDGLTDNPNARVTTKTQNNPAGAETRPRNVAVYYYVRIN